MNDHDSNLTERRTNRESSKGPLFIRDIVKYLSNMVKLNEDPRTGNVELSKGLKQLANSLKPYSKRSLHDIADIVKNQSFLSEIKPSLRKIDTNLPESLDSLKENVVEEILNNSDYQKFQLIELGAQRFGISRSKLERLNKEAVIESIRSALNHERSIEVISQEARRSGEKRSS